MPSPSSILVCVEICWSDAVLGSVSVRAPARVLLGEVCLAIADRPEAAIAVESSPEGAVVRLPGGPGGAPVSRLVAVDAVETIELGAGLRLCVRAVRDERRALRRGAPGAMGKLLALSLLTQASIVGALAWKQPALMEDDQARLRQAQGYLIRAAEREMEEAPTEEVSPGPDLKEGGTGTRAKGEEGSMGNPSTRAAGSRYGVKGPSDNPDPHIARQAALRESSEFGIIGLLNSGAGGDPAKLDGVPGAARGSMWGDDIGDSFGAGGLGLHGIGAGGSGRGFGGGPVRVGGAPRGSTASRPRRGSAGDDGEPAAMPQQQAPGVKAGEWDDNANYREFLAYMASNRTPGHRVLDVSDRQFLVVRDADGRAVPGCAVSVSAGGAQVQVRTGTSGRALLFPRAEGIEGGYTATARCLGQTATARVGGLQADAVIKLDLPAARVLPARRTIDVAFVLDTTGSMSEEIEAVKGTIQKVTAAANRWQVGVRLGLVEFRDRGDDYVTRVHPFTADIEGFSSRIASMRASGGGDTPEAVEEGLNVALSDLEWSQTAVARMAFLIGDAPPHLGQAQQGQGRDYADAMRRASHEGIPLYTIAASGMDAAGQLVFRQVAQFTGATNMFVLRGGAGPASVGGGDPRSSCGGTQTSYASGNLDQLITQKIERELAALDGDPLQIAGLGRDDLARPCPAAPAKARSGG